jgi:Holliday junction resolvase RusA-like endonuclease
VRWQKDIARHLNENHKDALGLPGEAYFVKPVRVSYAVGRPDNRKRDLDNMLKALNDALTKNHIIADDSLIYDLNIKWVPGSTKYPVRCEIEHLHPKHREAV